MAERRAFTDAAAAGQLPDPRLAPLGTAEAERRFVAPSAEEVLVERRARMTAASVAALKEGWRQPKAV